MKFMGYKRPTGRAGIRNHIAIIPSVFCANTTVARIAAQVEGSVALRHPVGCAQVGYDLEMTARTLKAMGTHPNVAGVLVVGLGCERFKPAELYDSIKASGRPVEMLVIQDEGGSTRTIEDGVRIVRAMVEQARAARRVECDMSELIVALKCGGTDATSGLAANPTLGAMCDRLAALGGSAIISELNELLGTEDLLAARAINEEVAVRIYNAIYEIEEVLRSAIDPRFPSRNHLISPGNFDGGVSSIVEKALGGYHKSGSSPIVDVLQYAIPPRLDQHGMFVMNYESHDGEVVTGMVGCGAQLVAFTTGRGNPTGFPIAPVLKVTGNAKTFQKMREHFDFDASPVISREAPFEETGADFLDMVMRVANGEQTASERFGSDELFCVARRQGPQSVIEERRKRVDSYCPA